MKPSSFMNLTTLLGPPIRRVDPAAVREAELVAAGAESRAQEAVALRSTLNGAWESSRRTSREQPSSPPRAPRAVLAQQQGGVRVHPYSGGYNWSRPSRQRYRDPTTITTSLASSSHGSSTASERVSAGPTVVAVAVAGSASVGPSIPRDPPIIHPSAIHAIEVPLATQWTVRGPKGRPPGVRATPSRSPSPPPPQGAVSGLVSIAGPPSTTRSTIASRLRPDTAAFSYALKLPACSLYAALEVARRDGRLAELALSAGLMSYTLNKGNISGFPVIELVGCHSSVQDALQAVAVLMQTEEARALLGAWEAKHLDKQHSWATFDETKLFDMGGTYSEIKRYEECRNAQLNGFGASAA